MHIAHTVGGGRGRRKEEGGEKRLLEQVGRIAGYIVLLIIILISGTVPGQKRLNGRSPTESE
jgi:hypothetical protein